MSPIALFRCCVFSLMVAGVAVANAQDLQFQKVVLDPQIGKVCYAVTAADVDGDGRIDAVAISEREAVWYRNPDWTRHTMISDAVPTDHVCIAAGDIDNDGQVDFALGAGWPKNGGTIHWIGRGASLDEPWQVHSIGAEAWTHRMRFADVLGQGREQLVVTPLNGADDQGGIRLLAFPIPSDPVAGPWQPVVIDGSLHRAHNHWHVPSPHADSTRADSTSADSAADRAATIVASAEGLTLITGKDGGGFATRSLASGADGNDLNSMGSGEIKTGRLQDQLLLATIEPMHGNQVVAYVGQDLQSPPQRIVLDDSFAGGHAVWCADLDGDGRDEIIAAHREVADGATPGPAIYLYRAADAAGQKWNRQQLDAPMACEDLWCADFNDDGRIDILAGGRATHDVNLYLNQTPAK